MEKYEVNEFERVQELDDDQLDQVVGGYSVGDVVTCNKWSIVYCPRCGKLLRNYEVTITGERGSVDGKKLYWCTYNCCGYKSSVLESEIIQ